MKPGEIRQGKGGRLLGIDLLRGVACLAVVGFHIYHMSGVDQSPSAWRWAFYPFHFGSSGVTIFIVLSGFCIHLSVARSLKNSQRLRADWGKFWRRRFIRLYPPYLAAIVLSFITYFTLRYFGRPLEQDLIRTWRGDLLTHLLMIHNLFPAFHHGLINGPFWSLGLEEQLYGLYMVFLMGRARFSLTGIVRVIFVISFLWTLIVALGGQDVWGARDVLRFMNSLGAPPYQLGVWEHWPFAYWFCWILGALAAESYLGLITLPSWCCQLRSVVFLFLALLAIHVGNAFGARVDSRLGFSLCVPFCGLLDAFTRFLVSLMVMVILNWLVRIEMKGTLPMPLVRPLAFVGLFSYSLYLTHALVLRLADAFVPLPSTPAWTLFRFILYGAASLLFAYGFFTIFERPFLKKTPRPSSSGSPAVSSDSFLPKKPVVPADSQVTN